jgi:hypothetical protein
MCNVYSMYSYEPEKTSNNVPPFLWCSDGSANDMIRYGLVKKKDISLSGYFNFVKHELKGVLKCIGVTICTDYPPRTVTDALATDHHIP